MTERVVLAYSGGLDTSVAIGWIAEQTGAEVVAVAVDVGQGGEDLEVIRQRALDCGAVEAYVADARDEFADEYCLPALQANALYMDRYPLVSALSRPVIVKHLVRAAKEHGGADRRPRLHRQGQRPGPLRGRHRQRSCRELSCIAPVRDLALTRDKAIEYAERHELPIETTKKNPYSIDQNVWGRAVETGFLEDIWNGPIEDVYTYTKDPARPHEPDEVVITFEPGVPVAIDGKKVTVLQAIQELNERAGAPGRRPARHGRGPAGRHQVPRGLRGPGRDRADRRPPGARERHRRARAGPLQARRRAALGRARLRRPVVLAR